MHIPNLHDYRPADDTGSLRSQVLVLTADIGVIAHVPEASLLDLLPGAQAEAIRKNRKAEDRLRRIMARLLLGFGLSLLDNRDAPTGLRALRNDPQGRPWLDGCTRPISLSHSGRWAACAIGHAQASGGIGVDVEEIREMPVEDFSMVFTAQEREAIRNAEDPASDLIRRWTIKEAVLKAHGTGLLADPLQVGTVVEEAHNHWAHLPLAHGYWLTVAASYRFTVAQLNPSPQELIETGRI
jgi:phosphopantetheine--protein transferase-like protein